MDLLGTLATSAVVSVIITSVLGPSLFFWLERRAEKRKRNFEIRYEEYKHYLRTLDDIAAASRVEAERFFTETIAKSFRSILTEPGKHEETLAQMNEALLGMTTRSAEALTKAEGELHGLRLVCTEKLLDMIDGYVKLQRELMSATSEMMGNWQQIDINDPMASASGEFQEKGERSQRLYHDIVIQMRKELDIK